MDLHDYKDVAENYDLYLDVMYKDVDNHSGFQDFYLDFAKEYGKDGVIDIACGTGAVIEERVRPLKMRQTYRKEMEYLLKLTGYEIVNVYGGYQKESSEGSAKNVIWCVRKR